MQPLNVRLLLENFFLLGFAWLKHSSIRNCFPVWTETWYVQGRSGGQLRRHNTDPNCITEADALSFNVNKIYTAPRSLRKLNPQIHPILSSTISIAQTQKCKVLCWGFPHPKQRNWDAASNTWYLIETNLYKPERRCRTLQNLSQRWGCAANTIDSYLLQLCASMDHTGQYKCPKDPHPSSRHTSEQTRNLPKSSWDVLHAWQWLPAAGMTHRMRGGDTKPNHFRAKPGCFHPAETSHTVTSHRVLRTARVVLYHLQHMPSLPETSHFFFLLNIWPKLRVEKYWA